MVCNHTCCMSRRQTVYSTYGKGKSVKVSASGLTLLLFFFFFFSSSQIQRPCLRFSVGSSRFDPACLRRKLILVDRNMVPARRGSEHDFLFSLSFMQEQPCVYHLSERPRVTGFAFCSLFGCQKKKSTYPLRTCLPTVHVWIC